MATIAPNKATVPGRSGQVVDALADDSSASVMPIVGNGASRQYAGRALSALWPAHSRAHGCRRIPIPSIKFARTICCPKRIGSVAFTDSHSYAPFRFGDVLLPTASGSTSPIFGRRR